MINSMQNENIEKIEKNDKRIAQAISFAVFSLFLLNLLNGYIINNINPNDVTTFFKTFAAVAFLYALISVLKRIDARIFFIISLSLVIILLSWIVFPQNNEFLLVYAIYFFTICLPLSIYCYTIMDYTILLKKLKNISLAISIVSLGLLITDVTNFIQFNGGAYDMSFSYSCLLPCIILINDYSKNKDKYVLVAIFILFITILLYGARGPLYCILVYIALLLFEKRIKAITKAFILFSATIIILTYKLLVNTLFNFLFERGIYSRTIDLLAHHELNLLTGRDAIYSKLIAEFTIHPFAIRGIASDRVSTGAYSHNVFLELLYSFGSILGGICIILLVYFVFKSLITRNEIVHKEILIIFLCCGFVPLLFSGALWTNFYFWIFILLCIKAFSEKPIAK